MSSRTWGEWFSSFNPFRAQEAPIATQVTDGLAPAAGEPAPAAPVGGRKRKHRKTKRVKKSKTKTGRRKH